MAVSITCIAHYLPDNIIPNSYFSQYLDTNDEWIKSRTGISERRFEKDGATSDMIVKAALECIEKRGIDKNEIDCVIVATVTPDHMFPSTAAVVQHKLGLTNAWGYDISAACSGYIFALATAVNLVKSGISKKLLLCGADKMTSIMDMNDRSHCILFGDGAGVTLIEEFETRWG